MKVLENTDIKQNPVQRKDIAPDGSKRLKGETLNSQDCNDLTLLSPLNEETVLQVIESRYYGRIFYSWAGVALVALNPFQNVAELYDNDVVETYKRGSSLLAKELPPHIFAVGKKAFDDLKRDLETRNQSIIVSGESGAGKTWTTRNLMHFITDIADTRPEEDPQVSRIEQRILNSNPILEAFGNATTVRNENSSRFGKYIQLQFDRTQKVVGATINTYLLEKTRVVHQAEGEKRFHIFEQITSAGYREFNMSDISYSSQALEATRQAMRNIGIENQLQSEIFEVLRGILSLCEVRFTSPTKMPDESCTFQDFRNVWEACESLGTEVESLKQCLALRRIITGSTGEQFMKACSVTECTDRRDCMAKLIYSRLFEWIVDFINASIKAPAVSGYSFIGLLDIYGFENFDFNSLEQLCINYANEKLQQHFVHYFMKRQQEEYRKEGMDWSFQDYVDNRPCLDLIEGKISIFSLINEECRLKRDLDTKSFVTRLQTSFVGNIHFDIPRFRTADHEFTVHHFAGSVCYKVEGLLNKNKDLVPPEVVELLTSSKNPLIQRLFGNKDCSSKDTGRHRRATVTVVCKFKASLDSLMSTLRSTNVHYIRCIKPNSKCQPGVFDRKEVLAQLNACGVIETVRISAAGFPIRLSHLEFLRRYSLVLKYLAPVTPTHSTNVPASSPFKSPGSPCVLTVDRRKRRSRRAIRTCYDHTKFICRSIVEAVQCHYAEGKENLASTECEGVKIGKTKIFFHEKEMEKLELARNSCLSESVLTIQKCWRRHRRRVERKRTSAAIIIQSVWRGSFAKKSFQKARRAAIIIQRHTRHYFTAKRIRERLLHKKARQLTIQKEANCRSSPTLRPLQCKSLTDSTTNDLIRRFAIRPAFGCWFDLIGTEGKSLGPITSLYARCDGEAKLHPTERNTSPLEFMSMLVCFSKHPRDSETTDISNKRSSEHRQFVNRSSSMVSRREIEKVPVAFHCQGTPLPYANRRPTRGCARNMGLAGIREMDHLQSEAELD